MVRIRMMRAPIVQRTRIPWVGFFLVWLLFSLNCLRTSTQPETPIDTTDVPDSIIANDTIPPALGVLYRPTKSIAYLQSIRIEGWVFDQGSGVRSLSALGFGSDSAVLSDSTWRLDVTLPSNRQLVWTSVPISVWDKAGNQAVETLYVYWDPNFDDQEGPKITIEHPVNDTLGDTCATFVLCVRDTSAVAWVEVNGTRAKALNESLYVARSAMTSRRHLGTSRFDIKAQDASVFQNKTVMTRSLVFDSIAAEDVAPPTIEVLEPVYDSAHAYGPSFTFVLRVQDKSGVKVVRVGGSNAGLDTGSIWIKTVSVNTLQHLAVTRVAITATDSSKNQNSDTVFWHVVYDTSDTSLPADNGSEAGFRRACGIDECFYLPGGWSVFSVKSNESNTVFRNTYSIARPDSFLHATRFSDPDHDAALVMFEAYGVDTNAYPHSHDWAMALYRQYTAQAGLSLAFCDTLKARQQSLWCAEMLVVGTYVFGTDLRRQVGTYFRFVETGTRGYILVVESDSIDVVNRMGFYRSLVEAIILPTSSGRSADAHLLEVGLSHGCFVPRFNPLDTIYDITVATRVDTLRLSPMPSQSLREKMEICLKGTRVNPGSSQAVFLDLGSNQVGIDIKAEDGTRKTYTVRVFRRL